MKGSIVSRILDIRDGLRAGIDLMIFNKARFLISATFATLVPFLNGLSL